MLSTFHGKLVLRILIKIINELKEALNQDFFGFNSGPITEVDFLRKLFFLFQIKR
jgi:hypothetical protein